MSIILGNPMVMGAGGKEPEKLKFTYTGDYTEREDGVVELRSSGTLNLTESQVVDIFAVGGGGKGGQFSSEVVAAGYGGGGGGKTATLLNRALVGSFNVVIGQGATTQSTPSATVKGGTTSFGSLLTAEGGNSAIKHSNTGPGIELAGADGGSGGGGGSYNISATYPGTGGSDGSDGFRGSWGIGTSAAGKGQGTTTREFGDTNGKLYAGGGGGGLCRDSSSELPEAIPGGSGGGGAGSVVNVNPNTYRNAIAGEANTGGGGGGGAGNSNYRLVDGGNGGSGIVCIRLHKEAA